MKPPEKLHAGPTTLSVCVIAKDEEATLRESLASLDRIWTQLVVVIDDRTTDGTAAIASEFGADVRMYHWTDDYAAARNFAERCAFGDYVLWIDADERLVAGHDRIREIIQTWDPPAVRSKFRDEGGREHIRQDLLRLRGYGAWVKKIHEYPNCPHGPVEEIVYEQIPRDVDRPHGPHGDAYVLLRDNLGGAFGDRDMLYLARQHVNDKHFHEAIGLVDLLLAQPYERAGEAYVMPVQRSHAAMLKGLAYEGLERFGHARRAYYEALREFDGWAEPWLAMGELMIRLQKFVEAAAFLDGSLEFAPIDYGFCDPNVYSWLRYDRLASALAGLGRIDEAERYLKIAEANAPAAQKKRLRENLGQIRGAKIRMQMLA